MRAVSIGADLWRAQRRGAAGLESRAQKRLRALVNHARTSSPYFRGIYSHLPAEEWVLTDLPRVTKPELMERFDDWVTDPFITRARIEDHISDPRRTGRTLRDSVLVCTSSGTTGNPGLFAHDAAAMEVYWALPIVRGFGSWFDAGAWAQFLMRGRREAQVIGVGAHFGGVAWAEHARRGRAGARRSIGVFGVHLPIDTLCAQVEAFAPAVLAGYPSAVDLLAREQLAGRLRLDLMMVATSGEHLEEPVRERVQAAFGCPVRDTYGTSETIFMAFECSHRWLHLSSDWFLLEPVQADGAATEPGTYSHTTLVTNLANHLQPIIRYDIGDSVLAKPEPCSCGTALPAFRLAGRSSDVLVLRDGRGGEVRIVPLLIGTVVDTVPGTVRTQVVQEGPTALRVCGETAAGHDPGRVWEQLTAGLRETLDDLGLDNVTLVVEPGEREHTTHSGKFRRVVPLESR